MTQANNLSMACSAVRERIRWLDNAVCNGGFATDDTLEIHDLNTAIEQLEQLSSDIKQRRDQLLANVPEKYKEAAE